MGKMCLSDSLLVTKSLKIHNNIGSFLSCLLCVTKRWFIEEPFKPSMIFFFRVKWLKQLKKAKNYFENDLILDGKFVKSIMPKKSPTNL